MRPRFDLIVITDGQPDLVPRLSRLMPSLDERVAILLRDKQAPRQELLQQAHAVRALTQTRGSALLISGDVEVALACDADGVHFPEPGGEPRDRAQRVADSLASARDRLGAVRVLGVSRHDLDGLQTAAAAGADYATLSPIFASPDKGEPIGLPALRRAAQHCPIPLFALGGVRAADVPALCAAGAAGVAVIREVLAQPAPAAALGALRLALHAARSSQGR